MFQGKCAFFDETVPSALIALWQLHNGEAKFLAEGYENFDYAFSMHLRKHVRLPNYKSVQCRSPWWIAEQVAVSRSKSYVSEPVIHLNVMEPLYVDHRIRSVYLQPLPSTLSFLNGELP
ncbi:Bouquet formation protein Bqt2 [Schizosaccharomyces pombe]|uniref:Telomere bouquet protein 2 n=1 Tax=Schizosaccharomyces pombe (strain 972 / ATCC 24843) TaxID=284812 RepID=BQT2_SCHPO|nr:bouquet formation protein Bqt2 [Schizosaccharomyces pombe]Q9US52.1 RecName: Full=Telomere bouquet protein 2; AltName: Full=Meiotic chromosome segregation protein bqt2; AltName: Full=Meiotically up-regulated gene 18 protein [Schizosaccharomyces pombe 972h-]BAE80119.1 bqt2 [Schizosaccharomyces pombe]CAB65606.1 bouquet formation protein Bqt2 [Schizosaccharomyces pombe]|eukprot:NP_593493.1 bouquet formation protein Bqt2 [Schizosaccharomyces pombe]